MAGCFGNHPEDRAMQAELDAHLRNQIKDDAYNKRVEDLAKDKFMALPDFYTPRNMKYRYTNMDDAIGSIKQEEFIAIARAIRDGDNKLAGDLLSASLMRICVSEAEDDMEDGDD